MSTDYNAIVDLGIRGEPSDELLDALADFHAVAASSRRGTVEVILTLPAESLRQAVTTALAVCQAATGREPVAVQALTTADFDAGLWLNASSDELSVAEAAELLGVTPSAVRQRLGNGTLAGWRTGRDWRIPRAAVEHTLAASTAVNVMVDRLKFAVGTGLRVHECQPPILPSDADGAIPPAEGVGWKCAACGAEWHMVAGEWRRTALARA